MNPLPEQAAVETTIRTMQDQSQKFNVQVSYSIQNSDELGTKISDLATEYDGTVDELVLDSGEGLVINLTFSNHKHLIDFIAKCAKEQKLKVTRIEKDDENNRKIKFIKEKIDKRISSFRERRKENRENAIRIKLLSFSIASLTTILLGLNGLSTPSKMVLQNVAFTFSAITTLLTAWDTFFNYRGLWIRYTGTLNELYELKDNLEYLSTGENGNISREDLDKLYQRYQNILNETNTTWGELRKEHKSTSNI
ncbi:SLATT domain-containing protein [Nostoc sp. CALU 1950]|uniref:SLATT domain-containing protein n=1 Tax=Nostoc sp. CALU 1950 TaxID=3104321 RepID=UPI003EB8A667